jgi:NAD(P)-dependent dehydrogenase (short-subunit alcohol dehydrogenase family)
VNYSNPAASDPIGIAAAIAAKDDPDFACKPQAFSEFALTDRVALITGANRGLGLEMAQVMIEAGARAVYCVDLSPEPSELWVTSAEYVKKMGLAGRLEYVQGDVCDRQKMFSIAEVIGEKERRLDITVANAGIAGTPAASEIADYPADVFRNVRSLHNPFETIH